MTDPYEFDGLNFRGEGYFVFQDYSVDPTRGAESYKSPWELWVATLARAQQGNFSWVPYLYDVYNDSDDYVLDGLCLNLLGDAAPASTVTHIRESTLMKLDAEEECDPQFLMDMSRVLFAQRRLADVPLLLRIYERVAVYKDRVPVDTYIEDILGGTFFEGGFHNLESNCESVKRRYLELTREYGSDEISLWQGTPFTIHRFAQWMVANIDNVAMQYIGRRIFEANTGIDCRPFFRNEEFQPLAAAAILEGFLASPAAEKFKLDSRYFFSHPLPD